MEDHHHRGEQRGEGGFDEEAREHRKPPAEAARSAPRAEPQGEGHHLGAEQQRDGDAEQPIDLRPAIFRPSREERANRPEVGRR